MHTAGRFPDLRAATTSSGIRRPVAVLPANSTVVRNLIPASMPLRNGPQRRRVVATVAARTSFEQNGKSTHSLRENMRVWSPEKGELGLVDWE